MAKQITLGEYIRHCCEEKHISFRELADDARLSYYYVSKVVNDQQEPALDALVRLAAALHVPLEDLLRLSTGETRHVLDKRGWSAGSVAGNARGGGRRKPRA